MSENEKLIGLTVSNGKYEGTVKVLKSVEDFGKVNYGDVVVVYASSPAWSVPLLKAGALIAEVGGILCHAALVAREMGIPGIVNIENVTTILKDGDRVQVDGEAGEIYVLNGEKQKYMYSIDKKQQLKDFAAALAVPVGQTDSNKWPVRAGTVIFPVRNILVREFLEQIEKSGIIGNPTAWRKAFDGPSQLWRMSHHLINGLVDDGVEKSVIAEKILLLLEGIAALNNGHYFERLGNHIILDKATINDLIESGLEYQIPKPNSRKLLMLSGLLWSYAETNYFVAHELTCEYHGPYELPNGYAVVRDFKNLCPKELWESRDYSDSPDYIRIITLHNNTLNIRFDAYNNMYDGYDEEEILEIGKRKPKATLFPSLLCGSVFADGTFLSENDVDNLINVYSEKVIKFSSEVDNFELQEIARKYMEVFWYRKKSLADYIGVSWKPSKELYPILSEAIAKGQPKSKPMGDSLEKELSKKYDFSEYLK